MKKNNLPEKELPTLGGYEAVVGEKTITFGETAFTFEDIKQAYNTIKRLGDVVEWDTLEEKLEQIYNFIESK